MKKTALLLIDIQNDFCPGGALAVAEGDTVVSVANTLMPAYPLVVASQDWHPENHMSFASQHVDKKPGEVISWRGATQILWPDHCVQGEKGANFHPLLNLNGIHKVVQKGTDREIDSYSAFFDNARLKETELHDYLQSQHITDLHIMGLATDYCVKFTALDAVSLGYKVSLILDGCKGVNLHPNDSESAVAEMKAASVQLI